jgi:hypothetical protein
MTGWELFAADCDEDTACPRCGSTHDDDPVIPLYRLDTGKWEIVCCRCLTEPEADLRARRVYPAGACPGAVGPAHCN